MSKQGAAIFTGEPLSDEEGGRAKYIRLKDAGPMSKCPLTGLN